jgi:simple sugar transport system ATP-binding protein
VHRRGTPLDSLDDLTVHRVMVGDAEPERGLAGAVAEPTADEVLHVDHVVKRFDAVIALRDVSLRLRKGEALGLLGDNGSGKSTLVNILSGLLKPDAGRIRVSGSPIALKGVDHARTLGIECVYQDLAIVNQMPVWQNIFLGRETVHRPVPLLTRRAMRQRARQALAELGVPLASIDTPVGRLSGGERQAVAVARILTSDPTLLLLDEPTAALGARQSALVLDAIARLRQIRDVAILMVAHNLAHVRASCDRINVLEDGRIVLDKPAAEVAVDELLRRPLVASSRASDDGGGATRPTARRSLP